MTSRRHGTELPRLAPALLPSRVIGPGKLSCTLPPLTPGAVCFTPGPSRPPYPQAARGIPCHMEEAS